MIKINSKILLFGFTVLVFQIVNFTTILLKAKPWQIVDRRPDFNRQNNRSDYDYLKFADSLNGMIGANIEGWGGYYIRRTTDGGNSWKTVLMDSAYFFSQNNFKLVPKLNDIAYPSTKLCIAVGDTGLILRTTNNGETWEEKRLDSSIFFDGVFFYNDLNGYASGFSANYSSYKGFETVDGGVSWHRYYSPNIGIFFSSTRFGKVLWVGILQVKETDSTTVDKLAWVYNNGERIDTLPLPKKWSGVLTFIDENNGWFNTDSIIGGSSILDYRYNQLIYHTSDGGHSWEKQWDTVIEYQPLQDIKFYDKNFGMASGWDGLMLVTNNGGKKWKVEFVSDSVPNGSFYLMTELNIVSPTTAFVIGDNTYIYKYNRTLDNFDDVAVAEPPKQDNSLSISPNPASDYIEINVGVQNFEPLQDNIRIYNVLGETVLNLTPTLPANREGVRIDISDFPPGLYFVRVGYKVSKFIKF